MSKASGSYKDYLLQKLKDPKERAGYLNAALEDGDLGWSEVGLWLRGSHGQDIKATRCHGRRQAPSCRVGIAR